MSNPIEQAAEVVTRAMFGLTTPSMSREIAYHLHADNLLVTPAHDAAVAAKALREAAGEWRTEEPQRSTYAHAQFFARELDLRADRIEAGDE